jgi:hypothetical protein
MRIPVASRVVYRGHRKLQHMHPVDKTTRNGECHEHPTSAVNLYLLPANSLSDSLTNSLSILDTFEHNNGCVQDDLERFDVALPRP